MECAVCSDTLGRKDVQILIFCTEAWWSFSKPEMTIVSVTPLPFATAGSKFCAT